MSLDVSNSSSQSNQSAPHAGPFDDSPGARDQWKALRKMIRVRAERKSPRIVFDDFAKGGSIYRWGLNVANEGQPLEVETVLSRIACGARVKKKELAQHDWVSEIAKFKDWTLTRGYNPVQAAGAVLWAAALPDLIDHLSDQDWWDLLSELQQLHEDSLQRDGASSIPRLLLGSELGLTLAWRLADLPSCARLQKSSRDALSRWCEHDEDSIGACLSGGIYARMAFASLFRSKQILAKVYRTKFKRQQKNIAADLATWVAALTTYGGGSAFGQQGKNAINDDTKKNGLVGAVIECDSDALDPAMKAAMGKSQTGGRLVWEVALPESMQHSEEAKIAVMLPEWDVRKGRVHVNYSGQQMDVELFAGKSLLLSGTWETSLFADENEQRPLGDWVTSCEYTDDDVHFIELEQNWTSGLIVQRQLLVVRDDRTVLLADSVLQSDESEDSNVELRYYSRLPLSQSHTVSTEKETRELYFTAPSSSRAKSKGKAKLSKPAAIAIPLGATEWRVGPTNATLRENEEGHLVHTVTGKGRLYAPIWFDFEKRRLSRKRTWRQLTIADELRIVGPNEATGYRIQMGSEQWMVYRSLSDLRPRTVLGKHLVADFFAGRFHVNDGSFEELITVDDREEDE